MHTSIEAALVVIIAVLTILCVCGAIYGMRQEVRNQELEAILDWYQRNCARCKGCGTVNDSDTKEFD